MNDFRKAGGIAALVHAAAYTIAIGLYVFTLAPVLDVGAERYLALLGTYQALLYTWIVITYWLSAVCLIVMCLAFHDRLKDASPVWASTATVLGLIWAGLIIASGNLMLHDFDAMARLHAADPAQAKSVWLALKNVETGLVSGNELVGGLWLLLISAVAMRTGWLSRPLHALGLLLGVVGVLSIIPPVSEVVIAFGPGMIIWSAWAGIGLLRSATSR